MRKPVANRFASLQPEDGMTMIVAIEVLAITLFIIAAIVAGAISLSHTTLRDANAKRALAAANSGLEVARYRLNRIQPDKTMCLTDQAVAPGSGGAAAGQCPPFTASLGNGVTYKYYVTPVITASGFQCAGTTVTTGFDSRRCITATGTSAGVSRRAQMLVSATLSTALFPLNGITAVSNIKIQNNGFGDIHGPLGSNAKVQIDGCATTIATMTWAPAPSADPIDESCNGSPVVANPARTTPYTLTPLDSMIAGTESSINNDNDEVLGVAPGFSYNSSTRSLTDTSDATLTLSGPNPRSGSDGIWVFNLCSFSLTHKTGIRLLNGAVARFFIDGSDRPGSGCSALGVLKMTQMSWMNFDTSTNPPTPGDPAALQFLVYGQVTAAITNQSGFAGVLYMPGVGGNVKITNKTVWYGAIAVDKFEVTNGLDFYATDVSAVRAPTQSRYARMQPGWVECRSTPTMASDPQSGCS